ncbi:endonuclease [Sphingobacteriaceae bacterium]|nr:endonuclease [Sphingobacteriaceae bacterium]
MPEGPSILILKEKLKPFEGKKVIEASGTARVGLERMKGKKILTLQSWGKHTLICFKGFFIRIHLLMFGSYRINERRDAKPRLRLSFIKGEINFYTCNVILVEGSPEDVYDMKADIMSDKWDAKGAEKKLKELTKSEDLNVCDALLDQQIFSGVGNIIKNEALFLARIHPRSLVKDLPLKKLRELIKKTETYTWNFYKWKKENTLSKHFNVYEKKICPRCNLPLIKENIGKGKRMTVYCDNCQVNH